jgi:hypothetical protein
VSPLAPLRVIDSADKILSGEMIKFTESAVLSMTFLKISNANEFSDVISDT